MQIKDILLEYDRARALAALGQKFTDAVVKDYIRYYGANWQTLPRAQELLKDPRLPSLVTRAIERIEQADPTPNKKYTQWMARQFASGQPAVSKMEDIESTLSDYVHRFHNLNQRRRLAAPFNDINRYPNAVALMDKIEQTEEDNPETQQGKADKVYQDDLVTVIIPRDQEAACRYGRQTRWCTAAVHGMNYFDQYNRQGPLYILIPRNPKHNGEKYQLHFASRSWMDENDDPIMIGDLARKFPGLFSWFRATNDDNMRQAFMLSVTLASDSVLEKVSKKTWELVNENFLMPALSDAEVSDRGYVEWLESQGLVDDHGLIDWSQAPPYTQYNDNWQDILDYAEKWVDLDPASMRQVVKLLNDKYPDDSDTPTDGWDFLLNWDKVLNAWLRYNSRRQYYDIFSSMGKWIERHVIITDDGQKVRVEYYAG